MQSIGGTNRHASAAIATFAKIDIYIILAFVCRLNHGAEFITAIGDFQANN
jgi:hypothetical protein